MLTSIFRHIVFPSFLYQMVILLPVIWPSFAGKRRKKPIKGSPTRQVRNLPMNLNLSKSSVSPDTFSSSGTLWIMLYEMVSPPRAEAQRPIPSSPTSWESPESTPFGITCLSLDSLMRKWLLYLISILMSPLIIESNSSSTSTRHMAQRIPLWFVPMSPSRHETRSGKWVR